MGTGLEHHARENLHMRRYIREVEQIPDACRIHLAQAILRPFVQHVRVRCGVQHHPLCVFLKHRLIDEVDDPCVDRRRGVWRKEAVHRAHLLHQQLQYGMQLGRAGLQPLHKLGERARVDLEVIDAQEEKREERDVLLGGEVGVAEGRCRDADGGDEVFLDTRSGNVAEVPFCNCGAHVRCDWTALVKLTSVNRYACSPEEFGDDETGECRLT